MLKSEELAGTVFYLVRKDSFLILDYSGGAGGGGWNYSKDKQDCGKSWCEEKVFSYLQVG